MEKTKKENVTTSTAVTNESEIEVVEHVKKKKEIKKELPLGSIIVTAVLAVLTLFTLAQTVQTASVLNKVKSGNFGSSSGASSASSVDNSSLPDMVGGC